jgi:hypothetical protein
MSITPAPMPPESVEEGAGGGAYRWYQKLGAVVFAFFCFELGVFLMLFPWLGLWDLNYFSSLNPKWREIWLSPYFRGAVSGIGLVNVGIAFLEVYRLRRFSTHTR